MNIATHDSNRTGPRTMIDRLSNLDRRWIFLMMLLSVAIPIYVIGLTGNPPPEQATPLAHATFAEIENLPRGSRVTLAFDFDPASEGELGPMATAFVRHAAEKGHKLYFMALWPVGPQMIAKSIRDVIRADFPAMVYGVDFMNLGFKAGNEAVIKVVMTDMRQTYSTDAYGTPLEAIPMMEGIRNLQDMDLIVNVSAGYPGTKEWVQYAATPYRHQVRLIAGCTGVQAPLLYPYIPEQLPGLLGAIKGAAEYEKLVMDKYGGEKPHPKYLEGQRRMGPQLVAHLLMIALIVAGNVLFFLQRRRGSVR